MSKALIYIRSAIHSLVLWGIFTPIFCGPMLLIGLFIPKKYRFKALVYPYAWMAVYSAKYICGIKFELKGAENIPKDGGYVVVANHQCTWETFYLQIPFTPQTQVIKQSLLNIPFFGWTFRLQDPIAIDRAEPKAAMKHLISKGCEKLKAGVFVMIFPEGTRNQPFKVGKFSSGGVLLAKKANVPMIPVSHNAGHFWRNDTWLKYPGTVQVTIHPPMSVEETKPALQAVEKLISEQVDQFNQGIVKS